MLGLGLMLGRREPLVKDSRVLLLGLWELSSRLRLELGLGLRLLLGLLEEDPESRVLPELDLVGLLLPLPLPVLPLLEERERAGVSLLLLLEGLFFFSSLGDFERESLGRELWRDERDRWGLLLPLLVSSVLGPFVSAESLSVMVACFLASCRYL